MRTAPLSRNIPLFYVYQLLNSFILDRGIWMLFLLSRGFSLAEIGLIEALFHAVILIFEIPTGYLADRYGKRISLLLSQFLGLLASACLALASSPMLIVAGFLLSGLVGTLQSGATSALVYETLQAQGREVQFKRMTSHLSAIALISMGISGSVGGFLSDIRWEYVYFGKAVLHLITFVLAYPIAEPVLTHSNDRSESDGSTTPRSASLFQGVTSLNFTAQIKQCWSFLKASRPFLTLSLLGMLLYSMAWTITFYSQVLFQTYGFSNGIIGSLNGAETWISAGITAAAYIGERFLGKRASIVAASVGFSSFLVMLSMSAKPFPLVSAFLFLAIFISYLEPLLESYLNELVPSSMRATMLSVFNMMVSSGMIVTFWTIGFLADTRGIAEAIQDVLLVWIPLLLVILLWCLRHTSKFSAQ